MRGITRVLFGSLPKLSRVGTAEVAVRSFSSKPAGEQKSFWDTIVKPDVYSAFPFSWQYDSFIKEKQANGGVLPVYVPSKEEAANTNLAERAAEKGFAVEDIEQYHKWTSQNRGDHLEQVMQALNMGFKFAPSTYFDDKNSKFIPDAQLNPVDWVVNNKPEATAFVYQDVGDNTIKQMSYGEFSENIARSANSLSEMGLQTGDTIALNMRRSPKSQALFWGAIAKGIKVVPVRTTDVEERIASFLDKTDVKAIFTTDVQHQGDKQHAMYDKMQTVADMMRKKPTITIMADKGDEIQCSLAQGDKAFVLSGDTSLKTVALDANEPIYWHQSSGTTSEPKIIPQTTLSLVKGAMDGHYALDVKEGDRVGGFFENAWVMGPAHDVYGLLNGAAVALTANSAVSKAGADFIRQSATTQTIIVPAFLSGDGWIQSGVMEEGYNSLRYIGFTGAPSNEKYDFYSSMLGLRNPEMQRPIDVSNYIGGTELGGAYGYRWPGSPVSLGAFDPAFGMDYQIVDDKGNELPHGKVGELVLTGPNNAAAVGSSRTLLNKDHYAEYFAGLPRPLATTGRWHGDAAREMKEGTRNQGRIDGIANIGGEKVSAAQFEEPIKAQCTGFDEAVVIFPEDEDGNQKIVVVVEGAKNSVDDLQKKMTQIIRKSTHKGMSVYEVVAVGEHLGGKVPRERLERLKEQYEAGKIGRSSSGFVAMVNNQDNVEKFC